MWLFTSPSEKNISPWLFPEFFLLMRCNHFVIPAVLWQRQHIALHQYSLLFMPEPGHIPADIYP